MFLEKLKVINFRNFDALTVEFTPGVNLLIGNNGQGKTNLVEALYFLLKGFSFRPGKNNIFLRETVDGKAALALLCARLSKENLINEIKVTIEPNKKQFLLNEKKTAPIKIAEKFPCVLFSPESLSAIKDGPAARRDLVDDLLVSQQIESGEVVQEFEKVLRSRNRCLSDFNKGLYSEGQLNSLLEALDASYVQRAVALTMGRLKALRFITPYLQEAVRFIAGDVRVDVSVDYLISQKSSLHLQLEEVREIISNKLKLFRKIETANGTTLVGPHKHEVRFLTAGNDARYFCSQGQQRALILGFKMAQIMYHYFTYKVHPFLFLDDVFSELDPVKGANLLKFLEEVRSQIFLTATDISLPVELAKSNLGLFQLNRGKIELLS